MYFFKLFMLSVFLGSIAGSPIHGQTTTLSGNISTAQDLPITDVLIRLTTGGTTLSTTADEAGNYAFENILSLTGIQLRFFKENDPVNGVSVLDLVLITRHILDIARFDMPIEYFAADVNQSVAITAFDMVQIRQLILGITSELPSS